MTFDIKIMTDKAHNAAASAKTRKQTKRKKITIVATIVKCAVCVYTYDRDFENLFVL